MTASFPNTLQFFFFFRNKCVVSLLSSDGQPRMYKSTRGGARGKRRCADAATLGYLIGYGQDVWIDRFQSSGRSCAASDLVLEAELDMRSQGQGCIQSLSQAGLIERATLRQHVHLSDRTGARTASMRPSNSQSSHRAPRPQASNGRLLPTIVVKG